MDIVQQLEARLAASLKVDSDFFTASHSGENVSLRLLHYPATNSADLQPDQLGAGEHTDYGLLTLLFQHEVGGLEVLDQNDAWLPIAFEPNLIIVNSGDLLERWTNGHYRSTRHRVQPQTDGTDRLSVALFVDPDSDVRVTPLASCVDASRPARFPPTTAGEHIQAKINASHRDRFDS